MQEKEEKQTFPRGAAADVWRRTLAGIPSIFGRLVYLASLRNPNTGRYEHHGLAAVFTEEQAHQALEQSHQQSFAHWLNAPLATQLADVEMYLSNLGSGSRQAVENWLRIPPYPALAPASARDSERELLARDFEAILEALRREYSIEALNPED